jgi:hypothetical protein
MASPSSQLLRKASTLAATEGTKDALAIPEGGAADALSLADTDAVDRVTSG